MIHSFFSAQSVRPNHSDLPINQPTLEMVPKFTHTSGEGARFKAS